MSRPHALSTCLTLSAALSCACASTPPATSCEPLGSFPGPEDFDLVELDGQRVVLASARDRRDYEDASQNGIWALDWATRQSTKLAIRGRDGCWLAPHGISSVEVEPGRWELWTINHYQNEGQVPAGQPAHCEALVHGIEHYRVETDGLHFIERLPDPEGLLTNPNELDVLPDGRLWLSNNPPWVAGKGLAGDILFRRAKGQVLHYAPGEGLSVAAEHMVFPNGIYVEDGQGGLRLWVSAAHGRIHRLELDAAGHERSRVSTTAKPKATLDNFSFAEGALWVTGHPKGLAFIRHIKDASKPSPTAAYRLAPETLELELVGYWKQGEVDTGATVWPLDGGDTGSVFVLGPAFDPGLRVCGR